MLDDGLERKDEACREWMKAIQDGEVEETDCQVPDIRKRFDHIEKDSVSPEKRASLLQQEKVAEIARNMSQKGLDAAPIAEVTGLSIEDIKAAESGQKEKEQDPASLNEIKLIEILT
jgi:hypothetical protein